MSPNTTPQPDAEKIGEDIKQALHRSSAFPKTIEVSVSGKDIKLTGAVLSLQDKKTAEATARAEPGSPHVEDDLDIV